MKEIQDGEWIEPTVAKPLRRNSTSVEQIQDSEFERVIGCIRSYHFDNNNAPHGMSKQCSAKQLQKQVLSERQDSCHSEQEILRAKALRMTECEESMARADQQHSEFTCLGLSRLQLLSEWSSGRSFFGTFLSTQESTYKKKYAFTLAEVLITLGIIGIVAAMTMPALMAKYQKQVTVNRLKKAYAEIAQAVQLGEAEYGMVDTWDWNSQPGESSIDKVHYLLENYIIKNLKTTKVCKSSDYESCGYKHAKLMNNSRVELGTSSVGVKLTTASGYEITLHPGGYDANLEYNQVYQPHIHFLVDIDGSKKGENKIGKDNFVMSLNMGRKRQGLIMRGNESLKSREELKDDSFNGCNPEANGYYCGALIEMDGWEIKDDYPW